LPPLPPLLPLLPPLDGAPFGAACLFLTVRVFDGAIAIVCLCGELKNLHEAVALVLVQVACAWEIFFFGR
jgi:hypothetical protein